MLLTTNNETTLTEAYSVTDSKSEIAKGNVVKVHIGEIPKGQRQNFIYKIYDLVFNRINKHGFPDDYKGFPITHSILIFRIHIESSVIIIFKKFQQHQLIKQLNIRALLFG